MKLFPLITISLVFFMNIKSSNSQNISIDSLIFEDIFIIDNQFKPKKNQTVVAEISGIEYTGEDNFYYLLPQSDTKPIYYKVDLQKINNKIQINFVTTKKIKAKYFDGESIRINPLNSQIYLTEELDTASLVYSLINNKPKIINELKSHPVNSGYEGMSFSNQGKYLWLSQERANNFEIGNITTHFFCYETQTNKLLHTFNYSLDKISEDTKCDNGISEILFISDNELIVVERAYIQEIGKTSVRVYLSKLNFENNNIDKIKLLTDFRTLSKIDNIEGVCMSADKKSLIFVSDNNLNVTQQTQIIFMKIIKK